LWCGSREGEAEREREREREREKKKTTIVLMRPSKQRKQIIEIEYDNVKNSYWPEATAYTIYKRDRVFELGLP